MHTKKEHTLYNGLCASNASLLCGDWASTSSEELYNKFTSVAVNQVCKKRVGH